MGTVIWSTPGGQAVRTVKVNECQLNTRSSKKMRTLVSKSLLRWMVSVLRCWIFEVLGKIQKDMTNKLRNLVRCTLKISRNTKAKDLSTILNTGHESENSIAELEDVALL